MGAAPPTTEPGVGQTTFDFHHSVFLLFQLDLKSDSNHRSNNICRISHDPFLFLLKSINIPIAGGYAEYAARCYAKLREPRGHVPRPVPVNCLGAWVCLSLPGYLSLPGSAWLPGYLSLPGYLLGQLGESVPDPAPVNLWTIQDYPSLIETIVLLKQCSSESCKSGRGAPPMLRPSQSSNGASVYTLDEARIQTVSVAKVTRRGILRPHCLQRCQKLGLQSCQLVKLKAPWDV